MKPGTPIIGGAAAVALICFFMPWVTISCNKQPLATLSGWQIATGWTPATTAAAQAGSRPQAQGGDTVLLLVLIAAVACLVLAGLCLAKIIAPRIGGIAAAAVAVVAMLIIINKSIGNQSTQAQQGISLSIEWQWGYFLTVLSYLVIVAGGVLNAILPDQARAPAFGSYPPHPGFIPPGPPQPPGGYRPPSPPPVGGYGGQYIPSPPPGPAAPGGQFVPPPPSGPAMPAGQQAAPPVAYPSTAGQSPPAPPTTTAGQRAAFCTNCGKPLLPDSRFCTSCGAPV